jgi:DnaJ-domain-containing protein 1
LNKNRLGITALDKDPREILGVAQNAGDAEIRAAYLRKVKENPPDRAPTAFERIRDAYELLRDPRRRALLMLLSIDPAAPLTSLLPAEATERRYIGPEPWLAVLKEKK